MRYLLPSTALAATLALAGLAPAQANLLAQISLNGGATFSTIAGCSVASGTSCNTSFTANGLTFTTFSLSSNSPGTASIAKLLQATLEVENTSGATGSVVIKVGDTGYMAPVAPPPAELVNNIAGTVVTGGAANAFTSMACVDGTNAQNSCPGTLSTALISASITAPGTGKNNNSALISSLSAPYSMTEVLTITLSNGGDINYVTSSDVEPVPEPASLAIFGTALLGMAGLGAIRRRRKGGQS